MKNNNYKKRICLYGGTFNPIHIGHINMAKEAYKLFDFEKIIFIPTGNSYLKSDVLDAEIRYKMVNDAISEYKYFSISDIEIKRKGASYTCDTLIEFHNNFPDADIYFLIGEDSLRYIEHWKNVNVIFELAKIIVARRKTLDVGNNTNLMNFEDLCDYLELKYKTTIHSFEFDIPISSSDIRKAISENNTIPNKIEFFIPEKVREYIKNNNIYK